MGLELKSKLSFQHTESFSIFSKPNSSKIVVKYYKVQGFRERGTLDVLLENYCERTIKFQSNFPVFECTGSS